MARAVSAEPEFDCEGKWTDCNPQTAENFSAVGYFFGKELYERLHVPIGLIFSSWGGTKIQSWISGRFLGELPDYTSIVAEINSARPGVKKLNNWILGHPVINIGIKPLIHQFENLNFDDSACSKPNFNDEGWRTMKLPAYWDSTGLGKFNGAVWFRKNVEVPASWVGKNLVLELGPVDDMDETYVNGTRVGVTLGYGFSATPRIYNVPGGIITDSILTIAVRVIKTGGNGGIWGNGREMRIYPDSITDTTKSISLAGSWKYLPVAEYDNSKYLFYVYGANGEYNERPKSAMDVGPDMPTMLFNGMIAPLVPYHIKGVIWYQGESNADLPMDYNNYEALFKLMIRNWRKEWGEGNFPFYYVQIAPYSYGIHSKSYIVRDAQFRILTVPNTGMAVTLDIGSLQTIHPPDKQEVGLRLALWALAKNYHKRIVYSGPLYRSMKVERGKIVLSFDHADGGLVMSKVPAGGNDSTEITNFLIAGEDSVFVKANVQVVGKKLIVYSDEVKKPIAVRYAWSNADMATLFNKAGLPAPTFRTDNWTK